MRASSLHRGDQSMIFVCIESGPSERTTVSSRRLRKPRWRPPVWRYCVSSGIASSVWSAIDQQFLCDRPGSRPSAKQTARHHRIA